MLFPEGVTYACFYFGIRTQFWIHTTHPMTIHRQTATHVLSSILQRRQGV